MMKINWKRVVIAAIYAELLFAVIYIPLRLSDFQFIRPVTIVGLILFMFLGGFWAARGIRGRFTLHGALVGFFANIFWYVPVYFLAIINQLPWNLPDNVLLSGLISSSLKILAGGLGGHIAGKCRKSQLSG